MYKSKEDFLKLEETSDEDANTHLENIKEIEDESQENYQGAYKNNGRKGMKGISHYKSL